MARLNFRSKFTRLLLGVSAGNGTFTNSNPYSHIGERVRRFRLSGESFVDGTVMSYTGPDGNGGPALW